MSKTRGKDKPKNFKRSFGKFTRSLKPWRLPIIISIFMAIGSAVLTIFGPKILGDITTIATDGLFNNGVIDWTTITKLLILVILLYVGSALLDYIQDVIIGTVTAKYTKKLRTEILAKISRMPISYFDKHRFGDTLSRMTNDIDVLAEALTNSLEQILMSVTTVIGVLVMMLTISVSLTLITVITVPISFFLVSRVARYAQKFFNKQQNTLGRLNNHIEEDYSGQLIIKANSHEKLSIREFKQVNQELYRSAWRAQFFSSIAHPITHILTNLGYVAICLAGGGFVISGRISIGDIQAFIQYVSKFNQPITQVAQITSSIQLAIAAAERIFDFLDEAEETKDPTDAKTITNFKGAVEFKNINFSYLKDTPVITNFSAKIKPGSQVAIVGPTGAGKTTMINLLMRFYDPDSGEILIDGVNTREMKRSDVRDLFGMVLQDTWLFNGTIEDNLHYGNPEADHSDVVKAAKTSDVHHFIESLSHGYKTVINEDSDNISAGEKQLLTIARAMVANAPMIILDEATSNVDTRTEQMIQDAFAKLTKGRTSFVIAHRLSTIRNSDLILVMNHGNIVEQGTHNELLKKNGFYAKLYNSQFNENT